MDNLALSHLTYENPTINGWVFMLYRNSKIGQIRYYYMYLTKCFNLVEFKIQPKYRNNGFGKYLLHQTLKFLSNNHNANKILLHVKTNNVNALQLYKDVGFKIIQSSNTTEKIHLMQWQTSILKTNSQKI